MKTAKLFLKLNFFIVSLMLMSGCPPYTSTANSPADTQQKSVEGQLSKTSTGQGALGYMSYLKKLGYKIEISYKSDSEIEAQGGHTGGGYTLTDKSLKIFIKKDLNSTEQAHVIAHELMHVQDEIETDLFLKDYPHVEKSAQNIVKLQNAGKDLKGVDAKEIGFVTATLFCAEVRAYTVNQKLQAEGLQTQFFYHNDQELASFIDKNYIAAFGQTYAENAGSMLQWCRQLNKISDGQKQLVW